MAKMRETLNVNLVSDGHEQKIRRQTYTLAAVFTFIVGFVAALGANASYRAVTHGTSVIQEIGNIPVVSGMRTLMFGDGMAYDGRTLSDRITILFLGVGGEGHDGAQLTDTMMVVNLDIKEKRVALLSIPRDLAYPLGGGVFEKINALNAYAEQESPGDGARRTKEAVEKLLEIQIQHVIRVDFEGFSSLVDAVGGIDLEVERTFFDPLYPTIDDKWTSITFKKGPQHMDGRSALVFARSRHGNNGEGTDFARSRRQQLLLAAIREKMLSLGTLSKPETLASLYAAITSHVQTDLSPWDIIKIAPIIKDFSRDRMAMRVLSDHADGELVSATVNGAFMLFPRKPDWSEIRSIAQRPFEGKDVTAALAPASEPMKIELRNGTTRIGFASQVAAKLEQMGYEILSFGNSRQRGFERTMIVDLSDGKKQKQLAQLRQTLQAGVIVPSHVSSTDPLVFDGLAQEHPFYKETDFLVILGEASVGFIGK